MNVQIELTHREIWLINWALNVPLFTSGFYGNQFGVDEMKDIGEFFKGLDKEASDEQN